MINQFTRCAVIQPIPLKERKKKNKLMTSRRSLLFTKNQRIYY